MRNGLLAALAGLLAGTVSGLAQGPSSNPPPPAASQGSEAPPPGLPATPAQPGPDAAAASAPLDQGPAAAPAVDGALSGYTSGCKAARFWATGEYLQWRVRAAPLPVPLLTLGDETLAAAAGLPVGALRTPGTTIDSPSQFSFGSCPGGRVTLGGWLDCDHHIGVEGSFFVLAQKTARFSTTEGPDAGNVALAVPFFNVASDTEFALQLTDPLNQPNATFAGAEIRNQLSLLGADVNVLYRVLENRWMTCGILGGIRYIDLAESLTFNVGVINNSMTNPALLPPDSFILYTDRFATRNQFFGAQLGGHVEFYLDRFFLNLTGKVAFGPMQETATIGGSTTTNFSILNLSYLSPPATTPTGLFAQTTNSGRHSQDEFGVVPEAKVQVGVEFWHHLRIFGGYNFLYLNNVLRPGNQIDRGLNFTFDNNNLAQGFPFSVGIPLALTPPYRPAVPLTTSTFWAQGVSIGLELTF